MNPAFVYFNVKKYSNHEETLSQILKGMIGFQNEASYECKE
jgi:hypothetical protein